jgi:hypothetical protein
MSAARLTDTEERQLDDLVSSRRWQCEQIDRLLGWEVFKVFATGNWHRVMDNDDFCDRIGVNKNYTKVTLDRVSKKARNI